MPHLKYVVSWPYTTGLPRDVSINTFHVGDVSASVDEDAIDDVVAALAEYYSIDTAGAGTAIADYYSPIVSRVTGAGTVRVFLPDGGPQVAERSISLGAAGSSGSFPLEVALCNTIVGADLTPSVPMRNRRGRHYLGPFGLNIAGTVGALPSPNTAFVDIVTAASERLVDALEVAAGSTELGWLVYSPTYPAVTKVVYGWVDNEYDTQRRREADATSREVWGTPPV